MPTTRREVYRNSKVATPAAPDFTCREFGTRPALFPTDPDEISV